MSMPRVTADISMSLDGFVTGPDAGLDNGLGTGGEALHTWAMSSDDEVDAQVLREAVQASGSVVMGRRLFDIIDGPGGWNDEMGYGGEYATAPPFFVVTHAAPDSVRLDLDFTFVTDGVGAAVEQAKGAAGEKEVVLMGGGDIIRQSLDLGVLDELRIHLAPIVLGAGTPLFADVDRHDLIQTSVRVSSNATHLTYEVKR
jgi:dihydrofolate reductase